MNELTDDRLREIEAWAELVSTLPPAEGHPPPKDYAEIAAICTELLARRAAASTSTEGAGVIEEAQTIAQRMRQIVQDVWDKREGYTDDQAWTDLHGQAMRLLEWDVRSRALNPPAPKVTTQERNA